MSEGFLFTIVLKVPRVFAHFRVLVDISFGHIGCHITTGKGGQDETENR